MNGKLCFKKDVKIFDQIIYLKHFTKKNLHKML